MGLAMCYSVLNIVSGAAMAVVWLRDVLIAKDKWHESQCTQVAQQSMVLLSLGMHICFLVLTAWIVLSSLAWEYAFNCCVLTLNLLRCCHAAETQ